MFVTLDAPYADTTAGDLSFALGLAEQSALHVLELPAPNVGGVVRLRLLGASHQVVLRTADRDLVETVACLPGREADLPSTVDERAIGYRFTARVLRLNATELATRVGRLRHRLADDPYALVGAFPGSPHAVTALHARLDRDRRIGWRTWHAYPQSRELVETETEVLLP